MTDDIRKGLEQDARQIKERILMGKKAENNMRAAEALKIFLDEQNWTATAVAKKLGVSGSRMSQFLNGKYPGNTDDLANKIHNFLDGYYRRQRRDKGPEFVETSVARAVGTLIKQTEAFSTDDEGKIGIIVGDGGHGKSHCLRAYARANKNTVYVEMDDAMNSTLMFAEIAEKLRIHADGSLAAVTRRLIEHLQNRHITIMLDESSSLKVRQLNQLRQVIVIKSRCPLVLAGNCDLLKTIMQPTTRKGYESLDQFTSRLMGVLNLDAMAVDSDGGLYTTDDIRQLYEYGGIRLTSDAVSNLRKICRTGKTGRLRTCQHIVAALHISRPAMEAKNNGEQFLIDAGLIASAIEELDLPVRARLPLATREQVDEVYVQTAAKAG